MRVREVSLFHFFSRQRSSKVDVILSADMFLIVSIRSVVSLIH